MNNTIKNLVETFFDWLDSGVDWPRADLAETLRKALNADRGAGELRACADLQQLRDYFREHPQHDDPRDNEVMLEVLADLWREYAHAGSKPPVL